LISKKAFTSVGLALIKKLSNVFRIPDYSVIKDAFYALKKSSGKRGIKDYLLHQKSTVSSRHQIGRIMSDLGLVVKTKKKFKRVNTASAGDPKAF